MTDGGNAGAPGQGYWDAEPFARTLLAEFEQARNERDRAGMREHFYVLASYYRRTLQMFHSALERKEERLAAATLENLIALQRSLAEMRDVAPHLSLSTLALETDLRRRVDRDLVYRVLRDSGRLLQPATIVRRFNDVSPIGDARLPAISRALLTLVQTGHAIEHEGRFRATQAPYVDANVDRMELAILVGTRLKGRFEDEGFGGLTAVAEERERFLDLFVAETGFGRETAALAASFADELARSAEAIHAAHAWPHAELGSSAHPRPYQRLLHATFRAQRYAGQVVEAPAGSGKTLVGMLCIEDWLRLLAPGQTILVLAPTVMYQRQWVGELCLNPLGLRMDPQAVFAGTPAAIAAHRRQGGTPAVLVVTYAALARVATGEGRGGFDPESIERFLQANEIHHVILDEVHKVVADPGSATAETARVFVRWLHDGSLSSLIGFSGTLAGYGRQVRELGLELASVVESAELIAQGWVAPFAEFGAPFSYSERERSIASRVADYRALLGEYLRRLGGQRLREWFRATPIDVRIATARSLGMYEGRREAEALIAARMHRWESGGEVGLAEAALVSVLQSVHGWADDELLRRSGCEADEIRRWTAAFEQARETLRTALPAGLARERLAVDGFGRQPPGAEGRPRDRLAVTFTGAYLAVRDWSRQAGEGRVATVRAILEAERQTRPVTGAIVFDRPAPLRWREERPAPGYRGAGGMFVELAGEAGCVPLGALAAEFYLPDDEAAPVHEQVADWILRHVVAGEQGDALCQVIGRGLRLDERGEGELRGAFEPVFAAYAGSLRDPANANLEAFEHGVLRPLREWAHDFGIHGSPWLSAIHHHLRDVASAIFDYTAIAAAFRSARRVEVTRGDGRRTWVRVAPTGSGQRRQRMMDLSARLIDSAELPFNVIIVSSWARTGWNVISPNVLVDATATRDVTAWQQLRGRAMRPRTTWSADAQRLVQRILRDAAAGATSLAAEVSGEPGAWLRDATAGEETSGDDPEGVAARVLIARNKVTHIYELVSARGSEPQIRFLRGARQWERTDAIAQKHFHQSAVRAADGAFLLGPAHAPLIVAGDPRTDGPEAFRERLCEELAGADERIVRGWFRAAPPGPVPGA